MADDAGTVTTDRAPPAVGAFPHARRVGNLLFLSGIGPRRPGDGSIAGNEVDTDGNLVAYDIESQVKQVFANVRAVVEAAGATWEDIVDVTVFLTDMKRDFATFNRLYAEHFATNQPTRTTCEVGALPTPIAVELKVIAAVAD